MLKLKNVEKIINHTIEFDIYVPLKIRVGHWDMSKEHTIYWRTGDFDKSLLEIGLGSETGILRSFTLTEASINDSNNNSIEVLDCETIEGTPLFKINNFPPNGFLDFKNQFNVYLEQNVLYVSIKMSSCSKRIKQGRIEFMFDCNNHLRSVKIVDITSEEMKILKQGLQI